MRKKKINKILGVALAILLPLTLVGSATLFLMLPSQEIGFSWKNILGGYNAPNTGHITPGGTGEQVPLGDTYENIQELDISDLIENVIIKQSTDDLTSFTYDGRSELVVRQENKELKIYDNAYHNRNFPFNPRISQAATLVISVGKSVNDIGIDLPVTDLEIGNLQTEILSIEAGVGRVLLNNLTVTDTLSIEGGIGEITIEDATLHMVDISAGIGSTALRNVVATEVDIDNGIGEVRIADSVIGTLETDRGLGDVEITNSDIRTRRSN